MKLYSSLSNRFFEDDICSHLSERGPKVFCARSELERKRKREKKKSEEEERKRREKNKGCNLSSYNGYFGNGNASKNPARYTKCTVPEF